MAFSKPYQKSKKELFAKIVNSWKLLTIFPKGSILDVWQGSEYDSENDQNSNFCKPGLNRERWVDLFRNE